MYLLLFSGKKDSVNDLLNFFYQYKPNEVSLLYVIGAGFRNEYNIPLNIVNEIEQKENIKVHFYVANAKKVQNRLMRCISNEIANVSIVDLCTICQFVLNFVYVRSANEMGADFVFPDPYMFSEKIMQDITIPFSYHKGSEEQKKIVVNRFLENPHIKNYKFDNSGMKCQLSFFHNYKFDDSDLKITSDLLKKIYEDIMSAEIEIIKKK